MTAPDTARARWRLHTALEISLAIKGLMALTEVVSGAALMAIGTGRVAHFVDWLVNNELTADPTDVIGLTVRHVANSLSLDTHNFFAWYLITQGMVKLLTIIALGRGERWFFPIGAAILTSFILYQLIHIWLDYSGILLVLTLFDIVVVTLVMREYRALDPKR
jgi:uncharacterized membrane protein